MDVHLYVCVVRVRERESAYATIRTYAQILNTPIHPRTEPSTEQGDSFYSSCHGYTPFFVAGILDHLLIVTKQQTH